MSPALSTIGPELNVSTSDVSWIVTAYLLSASVLTPILTSCPASGSPPRSA
ncbi:hypothetical protein AB0G04_28870 [Actinoplanes sp. NPDC023801]|uniref:hypothetical protein n=1 Tax=Actinoplanes sp. NPDC023801 TaxID=3154595 RepID=UPI00340180A9